MSAMEMVARTGRRDTDRLDELRAERDRFVALAFCAADMLLETGQPPAALAEYEASLQTAPGRFNSLAGAVRAAEAAGDKARAREAYARPEVLCARSDGARPELAALRASRKPGS